MFVFFLLQSNIVTAARIYKSVDEFGNVTYSSYPPKEAVKTEKISVPTNYDAGKDAGAMANIEAIKQTADQFEAERKQREEERKAAQKELEEEKKLAEKEKPPEKEIRYIPVYPPNYYYPGKHPHPKPHPHSPRPKPRQTPVPAPKDLPQSNTQTDNPKGGGGS